MPYALLADLVLLLHVGVVLFVVGGLLVVPLGDARGWRWVRGFGFRAAHLAAIGVIVLQAWLGQLCPLTVLEAWLRAEAGQPAYAGSFVAHWAHRLLYFEAPMWVFALAYTAFALLVAAAWVRYPPRAARSAG
jgi:hypothetical protein